MTGHSFLEMFLLLLLLNVFWIVFCRNLLSDFSEVDAFIFSWLHMLKKRVLVEICWYLFGKIFGIITINKPELLAIFTGAEHMVKLCCLYFNCFYLKVANSAYWLLSLRILHIIALLGGKFPSREYVSSILVRGLFIITLNTNIWCYWKRNQITITSKLNKIMCITTMAILIGGVSRV